MGPDIMGQNTGGSSAADLDEWITLDYADVAFEVDTNTIKTSASTTAGVTSLDINDGVGQTDAIQCWQMLWNVKDVDGSAVTLYQNATYSGIEFRILPSGTLPSGDDTLLTIGLAKGEAVLGNDFFTVGCRWDVAGAPDAFYQHSTSEGSSSQATTTTGHVVGQCVMFTNGNDLEVPYFNSQWVASIGGSVEKHKGVASAVDLGDDSDSANQNRILVCVGGSTGAVDAKLQYRLIPRAGND